MGVTPFTAMREQAERSMLRQLHGMLSHQPLENREQFSDLMKAAFVDGPLDYKKLADKLGYSQSTVHRWVDGRTVPHQVVWPTVVRWILDSIDVLLREDVVVELRRAN